ncbi:hypothetical protein [Salinisphaera japonica]|uniref:Uncharacterized protein n=1 Tax=Salinisphaera japonica YTM-1 TaxID=1209778 RepID=A0A423PMY8_9GAMM|nr:hypothetical protein [Salinisphaera japonica]ROO26984.1 hypothetical protein SAJA_10245 [Salinisphaera japonica YTM-1]
MTSLTIRALSIVITTAAAIAVLIHAMCSMRANTVVLDFAVAVSLFSIATYHAACLYDRGRRTGRPSGH